MARKTSIERYPKIGRKLSVDFNHDQTAASKGKLILGGLGKGVWWPVPLCHLFKVNAL